MVSGIYSKIISNPQHCKRFKQSGPLYASYIYCFPTEWCENTVCYCLLCILIISTHKHRRRSTLKVGIDHLEVTNSIERLYYLRFGQETLNCLACRIGMTNGESWRHAFRKVQGICDINNNFTSKILYISHFYGIGCPVPQGCKKYQLITK